MLSKADSIRRLVINFYITTSASPCAIPRVRRAADGRPSSNPPEGRASHPGTKKMCCSATTAGEQNKHRLVWLVARLDNSEHAIIFVRSRLRCVLSLHAASANNSAIYAPFPTYRYAPPAPSRLGLQQQLFRAETRTTWAGAQIGMVFRK